MKNLITKYLNDSISEAEELQLMEWLKTPKNQEVFMEFVKIHHRLNKLSVSANSEEAYKKLRPMAFNKSKKTKVRRFIPNWLKYAAVFVGVVSIGFGIYFNSPEKSTETTTPQITLRLNDGSIHTVDETTETIIVNADGNRISQQKRDELIYTNNSVSQTVEYNTLAVPYGKTFKLLLSDGTHVILNAGSQLKFPVNFVPDENRTVFLDGEAYFDVATDTIRPFIVDAKDMEINVLGTQFNVTSYSEDQKTYAVLVEGKVAAHNKHIADNSKILNPNEKVSYENNELHVEFVNVAKYIAWTQGELIFVDDTFQVIVNKLERKFDVRIENHYPELSEINISAAFTTETLEEVLKTFQTYKDFNWTLKNGVVVIRAPKNYKDN